MPRNSASLQHRPFLTPIWLTLLGAFFAAVIFAALVWVWATASSTTVIVIRHADKELNAGADPPLSAAGTARAALLSRMFADTGKIGRIDAIYVTPPLRNRMTAAPLAARLGLTPIIAPTGDPRAFARRVLHEHRGGRILIIGHSDTVDDIVEALSGARHLPPIGDDEYGQMYIVSVPRIGNANLLHLTY